MREIKFRAWHKPDGKMLHWGSGVISIDHQLNVWSVPDGTVYKREEVDIMQYTGLKDKSGVEIYESDIVNVTSLYDDKSIAWVAWGLTKDYYTWVIGETWMLRFNTLQEAAVLYPYCQIGNGYKLEVIGNIYQNPELLASPQEVQS